MDDFVSLLNTLEPGIVIFDKAYKIHYINRIVLILFSEVSPSEIFGKSLLNLHHKDAAGKITRMLDLLSTSKHQIPFSIKILSKDNRDKYLFMKLISLLSPNLNESLFCVLLYDITPYISDKTTHLLKIPVGIKNEIKLIDLKNVVFIEADNVYSRVYTDTGRYFSGLSLGMIHDRLPRKYFHRIHRSYVINLTKINKVWKDRGAVYVSLQGVDEKLPVSRNQSKEFLKRLGL
jgi:DNA-binding LytR/AlgR family response regulator